MWYQYLAKAFRSKKPRPVTSRSSGIASKNKLIDTWLHGFHADHPLSDETTDQYDRVPFAKAMAAAIASLPVGEGFVVGLHGPWGDGKTTVLNFASSELCKLVLSAPISFNPWRSGGEDDLFLQLFRALAKGAEASLSTKAEEITAAIVKYATVLRPLGPLATFAAGVLAPGTSMILNGPAAVEGAKKWAAALSTPSVEELRERLFEALLKLDNKIVLFVDDIDRLDARGLVALFRLIKACADLPNVIYVLAFDREMVAKALGSRLVDGGAESGRVYLEKIIQIPLAMPPASRADLGSV